MPVDARKKQKKGEKEKRLVKKRGAPRPNIRNGN
jgi:hypothetical protein